MDIEERSILCHPSAIFLIKISLQHGCVIDYEYCSDVMPNQICNFIAQLKMGYKL